MNITTQPASVIRPMKQTDVINVMTIETTVHPFPWTEQIFRDCITVGYHCWVIDDGEKLLGFAVCSISVDECHILNITIQPDFQRQGLGKRMMLHLLKEAVQKKVIKVLLEVRVSNTPAIELYNQLGFKQLSIRKDYYPDPGGREDALVLSKDLN